VKFVKKWDVDQGVGAIIYIAIRTFFRGPWIISTILYLQRLGRKLTFCSISQQVMKGFWWYILTGRSTALLTNWLHFSLVICKICIRLVAALSVHAG